jgi:hypothetical protein
MFSLRTASLHNKQKELPQRSKQFSSVGHTYFFYSRGSVFKCWLEHRLRLWSESLATDPEAGFVSRRYQIFRELVGLERGPLSLLVTSEELLGRKRSGSGLEIREYGREIRGADHVEPSIRKCWH